MSNPYEQNYGSGQYGQGQGPQQPQQPQPPYGQDPQYGAQNPQYGAPQNPQNPQYGAPQNPQQPQYGAPQQPDVYAQPTQVNYNEQPTMPYSGSGYGQPQQPQDSAPYAAPGATPPAAPPFGQAAGAVPPFGQTGAPQQPNPYGVPPQAGPFYPVGVQPPRKRNNTGAIVGAVVGIVILGAVGYAISNHSNSNNNAGTGPNISVSGPTAGLNPSGDVTQSGSLGVNSLSLGDCFNAPDDSSSAEPSVAPSNATVSSVEAIPCTQEHNAQVTGTYSPTSYDPTTIGDSSSDQCETITKGAVASSVDSSSYTDSVFYPASQDDWNNGDHTVICFVLFNSPTSSSVVNS